MVLAPNSAHCTTRFKNATDFLEGMKGKTHSEKPVISQISESTTRDRVSKETRSGHAKNSPDTTTELLDTIVILAAYNEAPVIGGVIGGLQEQGFTHILVVDDGSKDTTSQVAQDSGAVVVCHTKNRGAGAATMTGITYAKEHGFAYAVLMDSDGQHLPADALKMRRHATEYDVVFGSRLAQRADMPLLRKIANQIGDFVTFLFFGLYIHDSQSGFKVISRRAIETITLTFNRYEFCSEFVGQVKEHNLRYTILPITVVYTKHSQSKGHGQSIPNGFRMLWRFLFYRRNL